MIVERLWTGSPLRNFNYLIACPKTGEALAIDPTDHAQTLAVARDKGWDITQILNTHEHHDHTSGNAAMVAATSAKLIAHHQAGEKIAGIDRGVKAGDAIKVGRTVELECLDTPGHTLSHICLLAHANAPALFSGDTLFNAGAGNVIHGGDIGALFTTFSEQLATLPDATVLYPGHDYIENNLKFTLSVDPGNVAALALLATVIDHDPARSIVVTIGQERQHNLFFRLSSPEVIESLRARFPDLPPHPDARAVFQSLRTLRNAW
jgi:hydroxyacylglutathione hydrolase